MNTQTKTMLLQFGKFKGHEFYSTPIWYQEWLLKQTWFKMPKSSTEDTTLSTAEKSYSNAHKQLIRSNYSERSIDAMFDAEVMLDSAVENSRKYYGMSYDEKQAQLKWEYDEIIAEINVEND